MIHLPSGTLNPHFKDIFIVIFTRLTKAKTQKLIKSILVFFSYFTIKYGAQELIQQIDTIQTKCVFRPSRSPSKEFFLFSMFQMVVDRLYVSDLSKVDENEKKVCAVAVTHLLCDAEAMVRGVYFTQCWLNLFQALLRLFQSSEQLQITSVAERKQQEAEDELAVGLEETPGLTRRTSRTTVKNCFFLGMFRIHAGLLSIGLCQEIPGWSVRFEYCRSSMSSGQMFTNIDIDLS